MKGTKFPIGLVMAGLLAGLGAASVHANEIGKTREQVKAELRQALARGEVYISEVDYPPKPTFQSSKTREQVRGEARQAIAQGQVLFGETDYPPAPVATGPGRDRAEVVAEMMAAKRNGTLYIDEVQFPDKREVRATIATAKSKSGFETVSANSVLSDTAQN